MIAIATYLLMLLYFCPTNAATNKKIQEMNEQYQVRRSKMAEKLANAVKKKEEELAGKIEEIEKVC